MLSRDLDGGTSIQGHLNPVKDLIEAQKKVQFLSQKVTYNS